MTKILSCCVWGCCLLCYICCCCVSSCLAWMKLSLSNKKNPKRISKITSSLRLRLSFNLSLSHSFQKKKLFFFSRGFCLCLFFSFFLQDSHSFQDMYLLFLPSLLKPIFSLSLSHLFLSLLLLLFVVVSGNNFPILVL